MRDHADTSGSTVGVVLVGGAAAVVVWAIKYADRLPAPVLITACVLLALGGVTLLLWAIRNPDHAGHHTHTRPTPLTSGHGDLGR